MNDLCTLIVAKTDDTTLSIPLCCAGEEKQNGDEVPPAKRRKEKGSESPAEGQPPQNELVLA